VIRNDEVDVLVVVVLGRRELTLDGQVHPLAPMVVAHLPKGTCIPHTTLRSVRRRLECTAGSPGHLVCQYRCADSRWAARDPGRVPHPDRRSNLTRPQGSPMTTPAVPGFDQAPFTHQGRTHPVYRAGGGPAVIVIHEIPGLHPGMLAFAQRLIAAGYTVYLPSLFGRPGQPASTGAVLGSILRVCVSREFAILADRTSPIAGWLRALAATAYRDCGGPGVGAIGMCLTGGFALAMAVDPAVLAPVVSQPGLPAPSPPPSGPRLAWTPPTWPRSRRAPVVGCACSGCGFPPIGAARPSGSSHCAASWAPPSRGSRSTPHPAILTPSPPGRMRC
jgi:hypothetical protein